MKNAIVRARIDLELKDQAEAILKANELGISDAIRLFLRQVVRHGGLPFEVRASGRHAVSGNHLSAMKRKAQLRDRGASALGVVSPEAMLLLRPKRLEGAQIEWPEGSLLDD
jgi:addiction module RelB/DinJ family antitoxin